MRLKTMCILTAAIVMSGSRIGWAQRGPVEGIDATRDIPYADTENPRQRLDLYLPRDRADEKPLPVVAFIHGGGWRAGDKAGGGRQLAPLVASGKYAGVSIGYRLSGEAQWPAQIHDCKAAIRWIRGNAEKYNLDADKIAVWGTSAGGHLVSVLGTTGDIEPLEGDLGKFTDHSSRVTAVVNFFGPSNFLTMGDHESRIDHNSPNSPEGLLIGGAIPDNQDKAKNVSPFFYVTKDDAPHLIAHGDKDPLVPYPQSVALDAALDEAGVPSTLIKMEGGGHGFASAELNRRVAAFLGKYLRGEAAEISDEPIPVETRPQR
ncbi:MAG: alpha/beta hydrolase [Planctomycetales bacterium]|nr:alpha/beta hydrolase [Planctomycetales bacterium]